MDVKHGSHLPMVSEQQGNRRKWCNSTSEIYQQSATCPFYSGNTDELKDRSKASEGERGLNNMMVLLKTQCTLDIYHTQYNIIDPEVLLDAQKRPENYKDLLVRVAGYTAFFVELGKDIQDDIIQRTEIESWG